MKNVLAAACRALAALVVMVVVWCEETGRFLLRCMPGYRPPDPEDLVQQYEAVAETAKVAPAEDQRLANIQTVADGLFRGKTPHPELAAGLSERTLQWLMAMNSDMLILVAKSKVDDLREHMAGRKVIKGLLANDPDIVDAYRRSLEPAATPEPKPTHTGRSKRRAEPLLPSFGNMC